MSFCTENDFCIDTRSPILNHYTEKVSMLPEKRYEGLARGFKNLLETCQKKEKFKEQSLEYWKLRKKNDNKLLQIQQGVVDDILPSLKNVVYFTEGFPIGSFTGNTHTNGSDLDFFVGVKTIKDVDKEDIPKILIKFGFAEIEQRNTHDPRQRHRVFLKMIEGVEIEMKIRFHEAYVEMIGMHDYIDNTMSIQDKITFTFLKVVLKDKPEYDDIKMLYYCNAGYHAGVKTLLYPLL